MFYDTSSDLAVPTGFIISTDYKEGDHSLQKILDDPYPYIFYFNDPKQDAYPAPLHIDFNTQYLVGKMLKESNALEKMGPVKRLDTIISESVGGSFDFMFRFRGLTLVDNTVYNQNDIGNYLWGAGAHNIGFRYPSLKIGSELNGFLFSRTQNGQGFGIVLKGDSDKDQKAIKDGYSNLTGNSKKYLDKGHSKESSSSFEKSLELSFLIHNTEMNKSEKKERILQFVRTIDQNPYDFEMIDELFKTLTNDEFYENELLPLRDKLKEHLMVKIEQSKDDRDLLRLIEGFAYSLDRLNLTNEITAHAVFGPLTAKKILTLCVQKTNIISGSRRKVSRQRDFVLKDFSRRCLKNNTDINEGILYSLAKDGTLEEKELLALISYTKSEKVRSYIYSNIVNYEKLSDEKLSDLIFNMPIESISNAIKHKNAGIASLINAKMRTQTNVFDEKILQLIDKTKYKKDIYPSLVFMISQRVDKQNPKLIMKAVVATKYKFRNSEKLQINTKNMNDVDLMIKEMVDLDQKSYAYYFENVVLYSCYQAVKAGHVKKIDCAEKLKSDKRLSRWQKKKIEQQDYIIR